ncbi:unnamed protein product, partial [Rotaria sordida]
MIHHINENNLQIRPPNSSILSSVQYLYIESIEIDLLNLITVTPMLHTLECKIQNRSGILHNIYPRPMYLQQLRIDLHSYTWIQIAALLWSYPQLVYLVIIADDVNNDMADGFAWELLLKEIKHFEFKFEFSEYASREQPLSLDSFRSKFWLEEKKWFVTYDRSSNPNDYSVLYSNCSSIIVNPPHEIFGTLISETTASVPLSFFHVHRLAINDEYLKYPFLYSQPYILSSNDIDALCRSFPHIEQLDIDSTYITDLAQLLNRMKMTLTYIMIRQQYIVNDEQLIT